MTVISAPQPTAAAAPGHARLGGWRSANGRLWMLQATLAVAFATAAAPKLSGDPNTLAQLAGLGVGSGTAHLIGALEIAGALGLLISRLCGLAALGLVGLMLGATGLTVVHLGAVDAIVPAAFLAATAVAARGRRDRTTALIAAAAHRTR